MMPSPFCLRLGTALPGTIIRLFSCMTFNR